VNLVEGQTPDRALRKFPPHIVLDPTDEMEILQREIFGPLLPIKTYRTKEEIRETLMQVAIYAGVPAAVDSFRVAKEALAEIETK